jgi:glycosyltransferase involved in cell wall biosynthesis
MSQNKPYPDVSVVIPTFNRPKILLETINSIRKSSPTALIIVVNDGSSPIEFEDNLIHVINLPNNSGEASAINEGWKVASTKYLAVISDDDPQPEEWLNSMIQVASDNPGFVAYYPSTTVKRVGRKDRIIKAIPYDKNIFLNFLRSPCLAGAIINREMLLSANIQSLRPAGVLYPNDLIQWLELSKYGDFFPAPEITSYWWVHTDQLSMKISAGEKSFMYYKNVVNWQLNNISKTALPANITATFLRSVQFLIFADKGKIQTLRILFKLHSKNLNLLGVGSLKRFFLILKIVLNLILYKVKYEKS